MFRFGDIARENKGSVFNLVLSFCMLLLGPYLIHEIKLVKELDHTNFVIAFLLLFGLLAEPYGLYIKINSIYASDHRERDFTGRFIYLWLAHCVITVLTTLTMAFAMPGPLKWLNLPLFWIIGIKEFILLFFLLSKGILIKDEGDKKPKLKKEIKKIPEQKVFLADIILSIYAFLVFAVTWQSVGASGFLSGIMNELADSFLFRLFMYTFMFFLIYYPIRMGHFIEEWLAKRTPEQKRNYRLSLLVAMASCIGPLFVGAKVPEADEINLTDRAGRTPLIKAIEYEPQPYLKRLIDAGADMNAQDTSGRTALHYAAKGGRYEAMELLLQSGANPNIRSKSGGTPLALTAGFRHYDAMEMLLKYGADPNIPYYDGDTPLMVAAEQGFSPENIELLLKYKADANQQNENGYNAIMKFSHYHNITDEKDKKILQLLIEKTDLKQRDKKGHSIVWHATGYNGWAYTDVASYLIGAGASFDSTDIINKGGYNILTGEVLETVDSTGD